MPPLCVWVSGFQCHISCPFVYDVFRVFTGVIHYNGVLATESNFASLPVDKRRAFELYNIAAESGSKEAWRNLASMYYLGDGVPKSEETAKQIMSVIFKVKRTDE